jgi:VWFA-related protein
LVERCVVPAGWTDAQLDACPPGTTPSPLYVLSTAHIYNSSEATLIVHWSCECQVASNLDMDNLWLWKRRKNMERSRSTCAVLLFWSSLGLAFAQEKEILPSSTAPAIQEPMLSERRAAADVSEGGLGHVKLDVVITDKSRKPIAGLAREDFTLLDDNQPTKILSFQAFDGASKQVTTPPTVALLLDTVNAGVRNVSYERQEIEKFLRQDGGHLAQPLSVLLLTYEGASMLVGPSSDGNALASALSRTDGRVRVPTVDPTTLGNAISVPTLAQFVQDETNKPGRKLLIWVGPGWREGDWTIADDRSKYEEIVFKEIIRFSTRLREARIALYNVTPGDFSSREYEDFLKGVKQPRQANPQYLDLKVLATESGGRVMGPNSDLVGQINGCVADANTFYTISFDPPRTDHANEYHDLKVQVSKPGLAVRTNTGYYNQVDLWSNRLTARLSTPVLKIAPEPTAVATHPVSVDELEDMLRGVQGMPDADAARRLSGLELTERLKNIRLSSWKPRLPGTKTWDRLVALADASAFLALPADENPDLAPPDVDAQRQMLSRNVDYLSKTIPRLPNLFATRATVRYDDSRQAGATEEDGRSWRMTDTSRATVLYRDGKEVVNLDGVKARKRDAKDKGLVTQGTFGFILYSVFMEAVHSGLSWSHWEQGGAGPEAVFTFAVPKDSSHYDVDFPDPLGTSESQHLKHRTGYHGEIAVDPATGAILRLAVAADLDSSSPLVRADIMVEYGPVEIGGKSYICPLKSVSISRLEIPITDPAHIVCNISIFFFV